MKIWTPNPNRGFGISNNLKSVWLFLKKHDIFHVVLNVSLFRVPFMFHNVFERLSEASIKGGTTYHHVFIHKCTNPPYFSNWSNTKPNDLSSKSFHSLGDYVHHTSLKFWKQIQSSRIEGNWFFITCLLNGISNSNYHRIVREKDPKTFEVTFKVCASMYEHFKEGS